MKKSERRTAFIVNFSYGFSIVEFEQYRKLPLVSGEE